MKMPRIAIVYDWADKMGGVERLLTHLFRIFPDADLFSSVHSREAVWTRGIRVRTSFIQNLPPVFRRNRIITLPFFPFAFESFDFSGYDGVLSVSSSFAKGVLTRPETPHVNIMLTPPRWLWDLTDNYRGPRVRSVLGAPVADALRRWDVIAAQRPDRIFAISQLVASRCRKHYGRKAEVLYPPFDAVDWKNPATQSAGIGSGYFLIVSRLEPYKAVDLAIRAFAKLPRRTLVIVGTGSQEKKLRAISGANIRFLGPVSDAHLSGLYAESQGVLMLQEEDFGYTALEALAHDRPVLSYLHSGAAEIVEAGRTGMLVSDRTPEGLAAAIERFASVTYNVRTRRKAILRRFSSELFRLRVTEALTIH